MITVTLMQIAYKNIKRSQRTYLAYLLSSTVTILLFYLFSAAAMHPNLTVIENGSTLSIALGAGNFIIYGFSFLFIGYSSWAFLMSRGKQLGTYIILGMSPKQMKKMLFWENVLIGLVAIALGLIGGILFSGLFFKLVSNLFGMGDFQLYVPIVPVLLTTVLFFGLFLIIGWLTPRFVSHQKILYFLKSDRSYAQRIQLSLLKIILSGLVLGGLISLLTPSIGSRFGEMWTPLLGACGVGFIFLLTPQLGAIYVNVKKSSKDYLKGINLFATSEVSTSLKENTTMLSLNTLLLTVAFLTICALGSMERNVLKSVTSIMPFPYIYIERPENTHALTDIKRLDDQLLSMEGVEKISYEILRKEYGYGFLKASDFNQILIAKGTPPMELASQRVLILPGDKNMKLKNLSLLPEAKEQLNEFLTGDLEVQKVEQMVSQTGAYRYIYVIDDPLWQQLKDQAADNLSIESYTAYQDKQWLNHLKVADELEKELAQDEIDWDYSYSFSTLGRYYESELLTKKLCLFVGVSISIIFLVASVSLIYFRLYTSLDREQQKYHALYKLGFSRQEMYQTIGRKVRGLLWAPFSIALSMMWLGVFYIESQTAISILTLSLKYSALFLVLYFLFYGIVVRVYRHKFIEE